MNVGQILETHLGWAAKLLGFYAKTPVFQGANEKEIGLLLKIAGLTWVRDALALETPKLVITDDDVRTILADIKPERVEGGKVVLLNDATLNELGGRAVSQGTRDIYHRIRDFIAAAARELVERESTVLGHELAFHQTRESGPFPDEEGRVQGARSSSSRRWPRCRPPSSSPIRRCRRSPACLARNRMRMSTPRRWRSCAWPESRPSAR